MKTADFIEFVRQCFRRREQLDSGFQNYGKVVANKLTSRNLDIQSFGGLNTSVLAQEGWNRKLSICNGIMAADRPSIFCQFMSCVEDSYETCDRDEIGDLIGTTDLRVVGKMNVTLIDGIFQVGELNNQGEIHFNQNAKIKVDNLNNKGKITSDGTLDVIFSFIGEYQKAVSAVSSFPRLLGTLRAKEDEGSVQIVFFERPGGKRYGGMKCSLADWNNIEQDKMFDSGECGTRRTIVFRSKTLGDGSCGFRAIDPDSKRAHEEGERCRHELLAPLYQWKGNRTLLDMLLEEVENLEADRKASKFGDANEEWYKFAERIVQEVWSKSGRLVSFDKASSKYTAGYMESALMNMLEADPGKIMIDFLTFVSFADQSFLKELSQSFTAFYQNESDKPQWNEIPTENIKTQFTSEFLVERSNGAPFLFDGVQGITSCLEEYTEKYIKTGNFTTEYLTVEYRAFLAELQGLDLRNCTINGKTLDKETILKVLGQNQLNAEYLQNSNLSLQEMVVRAMLDIYEKRGVWLNVTTRLNGLIRALVQEHRLNLGLLVIRDKECKEFVPLAPSSAAMVDTIIWHEDNHFSRTVPFLFDLRH